ncbi:MAG: hypothetical protein M1834_006118 [Cirrosporium novae-zelandiae]|nr:MAG: hypothetical protein M1834_006118 [Cirrosporium novae-zelandiae]
MATYEIEHSISTQPTSQPRPNRFDFTDFFSTIDSVDTRTSHTNPHALPTPPDVSGVFRSLAESFERYRLAREREGQEEGHSEEPPALLTDLISQLLNEADMPPKEVKGVPDGYMDGEIFSGFYWRDGLAELVFRT